MQSVLDIFNIVFFAIFFLEMVIKVIGLGPIDFIRDFYNIFDALIVILSIVDVSLSYSTPESDDGNSSKGAISAFRAFRLLRVFKLAKSWKQLNSLIQTIAKSLQDISSFSVLLFLLMFIYILLGMQIFAQSKDSFHGMKPPRMNFRNFLNGFILVFTVLTGENWDSTMFQFAKSHGYIAIFYFISLVIIGVMIFLNLFLAILLENFEEGGDDEEEENQSESGSFVASAFTSFKLRANLLFEKCICKKQKIMDSSEMHNPDMPLESPTPLKTDMNFQKSPGNKADRIIQIGTLGLENTVQNVRDSLEGSIYNGMNKNTSDFQLVHLPDYTRNPQQDIFEDSTHHQQNSHQITIGALTLKHQEKPPRNVLGAISIRDDDASGNNQQYQQHPSLQDQPTLTTRAMAAKAGHGSIAEFSEQNAQQMAEMDIEENDRTRKLDRDEFNNTQAHLLNFNRPSRHIGDSQLRIQKNASPPFHAQDFVPRSMHGGSSGGGGNSQSQKNTKSIALLILQKGIEKQQASQFMGNNNNMRCEGNSLILMGPDNCFRIFINRIVKSQKFDMFILFLIAVSSILLALDNPLNDPKSKLSSFLKYSDYILTSFFLAESILKIIAFGFIFNGEISYLRNGWNIIDFTVVIISIASLVVTGNKFKIVKIFRLLRILRPLRVVSKNKGLKIGIQALFSAIPRLFNVTIISLLFFIICGIIGINYFKGTFYSCYFGPAFPTEYNEDTYQFVKTKNDCLNLGGTWKNADSHFDNMAEAISTMFQMSTTEGWIDVMNNGIDSVGIDMQPIVENNVYWSFFFMVFIFFGNFLILNLFTGVVCDTYNNEKEILTKNYLLTDHQKKWLEYKKQCMNLTPKFKVHQENIGGCRHKVHTFTTSRKFELFILICIMLNTVTLCINWYSQSVQVDDILDYINYGFAFIFAIEAVLKLISFGFKAYFRDQGNIFDFLIVILTIVTSIISITMRLDFGASTTFIRALRMSRIFKFVQKSKQIKVIFETLVVTIPALTNIGGLLLLLLYMFSVLGVFLFAEVQLQNTLDLHANFQSFGIAFLTLLRCSTGEAWNSLMLDTMRQRSILFQCSEDDFDYDTYLANGMRTQGCGSGPAGIIFFIAYFLLVPLFFLDLFVAIILEGFEQTSKQANSLIQEEHFDQFRDTWLDFDPDGTGFIKIRDFADFMLKLSKPLGWTDDFQGNFELQDDFLEELNIPSYNNFQDFHFYDVIQALVKVYLVNHEMRKRAAGLATDDSFHTDSSMEDEEDVEDEDENQESPDKNHSERYNKSPSPSKKPKRQMTLYIDQDEKIKLRLEFEFESLDDEKQDVMDVEEIKAKENRLMKAFISKQDPTFTSAHFKAARKILVALRRLQHKKQINEAAAIYGIDSSHFTQGPANPTNGFDQNQNKQQLRGSFGVSNNSGTYQTKQSRVIKSTRFDQGLQKLGPILEEEVKKQGNENSSTKIQRGAGAQSNANHQGKLSNHQLMDGGVLNTAGEAEAIIQDYQDEIERQAKKSGAAAPAVLGIQKVSQDIQGHKIQKDSHDPYSSINQNLLFAQPKEGWADQDRDNHSQMEKKSAFGADVNNQQFRRAGTTGTGAQKPDAPKNEDSESYLGGGMTIDASSHTFGGAQKIQKKNIANPFQHHPPEMFYADRNSSPSMQ